MNTDNGPMFDSGNYLTAEKDVIERLEKIMESDAKKELLLWEAQKKTSSR